MISTQNIDDTREVHEMKLFPVYADLDQLVAMGIGNLFNGLDVHPNPRLYKSQWRIFWRESPVDGIEFMQLPFLSIKAACEVMVSLNAKREPFIAYRTQIPREGVSLWNREHSRFKGVVFAPAYEDDLDPITAGGHR